MTFSQIKELWNDRQVEVALALVGITMIGGGIFWWKTMESEEVKVEIISGASGPAELGIEGEEIAIDVSGAVRNPGVYQLNINARVVDALDIAGGVTDIADLEWIDKYLNRSAKVSDGQKIYIPEKSQTPSTNTQTPLHQGSAGQTNFRININTGGSGELETLPGVGPVTAGKIIGGRPYGKPEDLVEKKIITQKVFDQIKEQISVW